MVALFRLGMEYLMWLFSLILTLFIRYFFKNKYYELLINKYFIPLRLETVGIRYRLLADKDVNICLIENN